MDNGISTVEIRIPTNHYIINRNEIIYLKDIIQLQVKGHSSSQSSICKVYGMAMVLTIKGILIAGRTIEWLVSGIEMRLVQVDKIANKGPRFSHQVFYLNIRASDSNDNTDLFLSASMLSTLQLNHSKTLHNTARHDHYWSQGLNI